MRIRRLSLVVAKHVVLVRELRTPGKRAERVILELPMEPVRFARLLQTLGSEGFTVEEIEQW